MLSHQVDGAPGAREEEKRPEGRSVDEEAAALERVISDQQPIGYLTTEHLAALWNERSREVEIHRREHPDDLREIETRRLRAAEALHAYRLLSALEQQLGFALALPVLGPWREPGSPKANDPTEPSPEQ